MSIVVVGNTGSGKSHICNEIFKRWGSTNRFKSTSANTSVTNSFQRGSFTHGPSGQTITLIDTPGFFDTQGESTDSANLCKLVSALESCEKLYGIIYVYTDRFATPQKIWYDRIFSIVGEFYRAHILLVHNKLDKLDLETKILNGLNIKEQVGFPQPYFWSSFNGPIKQYDELVEKCIQNIPMKLSDLVVPEACYEKIEESDPYDEEVSKNTCDEGNIVVQVKDNSHMEQKSEWNRDNIFGALGLNVPGAKKTVPVWVTSSARDEVWVKKMATTQVVNTYVNIFKVRFDGTKDLVAKKLINQKTNKF